MITKKCLVCNKEFQTRTRRTKFCSRKCNLKVNGARFEKGFTPWNKGRSDYAKKLGFGKWMIGKKDSIQARQSKSLAAKKVVRSGKHNFWKGGVTPYHRLIRTTLEYKLWREAVFKRDDYTCVWCKSRCGNGKKIVLNADHIQTFAEHPELRLAIDNGRTLCRECHYKRHSK